MARQEPKYPGPSWADITHYVEEVEAHWYVFVVVELAWAPALSDGAYIRVYLLERDRGRDSVPILEHRLGFPGRRKSGHEAVVIRAIVEACAMLENRPWDWPRRYREQVFGIA